MPSNEEAAAYEFSAADEAKIAELSGSAIVGSPDTVRRRLEELAESTQADELMITTMVFDHADRMRSYELVAEIAGATA
jgi:alkanesulfonate monooxygenase SsuD/methylene tetrahydromethanopterin reductase-like flavin-dependent oxidoreductase (luciferase family)